jgi:phosphohistidine swiveling domain-containing protein
MIKDPVWYIQKIPGTFHYLFLAGQAVMEDIEDIDIRYEAAIITADAKKKEITWIIEEKDMKRVSELLIEKCKNEKEKQEMLSRWRTKMDDFFGVCKELDNIDFSQLSDEELSQKYEYFRRAYNREYSELILIDGFSFDAENKLHDFLRDDLKIEDNSLYAKYFGILSHPTFHSFLGEEKKSLFNICAKIKQEKVSLDAITQNEEINLLIEQHQKDYYWILNSYVKAKVLDKKFFIERIKEELPKDIDFKHEALNVDLELSKAKNEKQALIKKLKIDSETVHLIELIDLFIYWNDERKKANLIADHYLERFISEISNRINISSFNLKYLTDAELLDTLKGNVDKSRIEKRKEFTIIIWDRNKPNILEGEAALEKANEMFEKVKDADRREIRGSVGSLGVITGKVKVVNNPKELSKLHEGDIIVTSMTRPEFVHGMKKAGGIITDEGGVTCHAAIVAREMKKPCVIGTKIATKILKDNELVEIRAHHGLVRRISKQ